MIWQLPKLPLVDNNFSFLRFCYNLGKKKEAKPTGGTAKHSQHLSCSPPSPAAHSPASSLLTCELLLWVNPSDCLPSLWGSGELGLPPWRLPAAPFCCLQTTTV